MSDAQSLHEETLEAVKIYQKQEKKIIELLMKNYQTQAYKQLGYDNLHVYCTIGLSISDAVAWSLSSIAKQSLNVPEIKTLIDDNKLTISNATQISRVITVENKDNLLDLAQNLSKRDLEKEIKRIKPDSIPSERLRPLTAELDVMNLVMSQDLVSDLKFLQDYFSKKAGKNLTLSETVAVSTKDLRDKYDPVRKAERTISKKQNTEKSYGSTFPGKLKSESQIPEWVLEKIPSSRTIPAAINHRINIRDQRRCTFEYSSGQRCQNTRYLDNHHKIHIAKGGLSTLENMQTLCSFHHRYIHEKSA